jgi:hypothetical protein
MVGLQLACAFALGAVAHMIWSASGDRTAGWLGVLGLALGAAAFGRIYRSFAQRPIALATLAIFSTSLTVWFCYVLAAPAFVSILPFKVESTADLAFAEILAGTVVWLVTVAASSLGARVVLRPVGGNKRDTGGRI